MRAFHSLTKTGVVSIIPFHAGTGRVTPAFAHAVRLLNSGTGPGSQRWRVQCVEASFQSHAGHTSVKRFHRLSAKSDDKRQVFRLIGGSE